MWDFKISREEMEARLREMTAEADKIIGYRMYKYFEVFEPMVLANISRKLCEVDWECSATGEFEKLAKAADEYLQEIKATAERVKRKLQKSELARIHILKSEAKISEADYRNLIERISGKNSSAEMAYWEGMILIRALSRIKERSK